MLDVPTGTITLLFTDIEGSTLLLQHVGEQYSHVLAQCRRLLHAAFQQSHGHEVDTQGDAFFFSFARATDAVSAAVAAQRALASHPWPDQVAVRVRMGLHTGEPQRTAAVEKTGYGLGFEVREADGRVQVGHSGAQEKTLTILVLEPQGRRGVAVMCNCEFARPVEFVKAVLAALDAG